MSVRCLKTKRLSVKLDSLHKKSDYGFRHHALACREHPSSPCGEDSSNQTAAFQDRHMVIHFTEEKNTC